MIDRLRPPKGATHKRKRVGRGYGTHGKTSGRGHKGQGQRGTLPPPYFEGGQTPLIRRVPKRGFPPKRDDFEEVNIKDIVRKFKEGEIVDINSLYERGLISSKNRKVKILGDGEINIPLIFRVNAISKSAREKIEMVGGKIELL